MKSSSSFAFLLCCVIILKFSSIKSEIIECKFNYHLEYRYDCVVKNIKLSTDDNVDIKKIEGKHWRGKTDDDVEYFEISNVPDLKTFPRVINNFFKNLTQIEIQYTNISEITSEDLKNFSKLKVLFLNFNQIEIIKEDTFKFNPKLEQIYLMYNKIRHIDPRTFSELKNLEILILVGNTCLFEWADNRSNVLQVVKQIEKGFCLFDEFTTTSTP
ncbi:hypothetical protein PVAND_013591 [Polypedilum vanderplanki]|uniref:Uncharacterized protein n=1 Tax=Polypedilum vanderplanki TaxID=319348 RepID=A0A9J6CR43_POLVA|nr:hypothetical protein PVAND_013591 [Polypedilum vanderplanki]